MARLILEHNDEAVGEYLFFKGSVTIGRHKDNTIVLDHAEVSSFHARIDKARSAYILTDLQSTNGTFVNGEKTLSRELLHGDRISVGKHTLLFVGTVRANAQAVANVLDKTMILTRTEHPEAPFNQRIAKKKAPPPKVSRLPRQEITHPTHSRRLILPSLCIFFLMAVGWFILSHLSILPTPNSKTPQKVSRQALEHVSLESVNGKLSPTGLSKEEDTDGKAAGYEIDESRFRLAGIVWSSAKGQSFAVINGFKVRVGANIDGATVTDIGRDYVALRSPRDNSRLRLTIK